MCLDIYVYMFLKVKEETSVVPFAAILEVRYTVFIYLFIYRYVCIYV